MLQFIIGLLVGGFIGFFVCALCRTSATNDATDELCMEKIGDEDARSE